MTGTIIFIGPANASVGFAMPLEIQTGTPPADGRYVVWMPCAARQVREWCEPSIQTWQGGRWHHAEPVHCWIGPLPVVNMKTGEIVDKRPCLHETTTMTQTGDGRDVETCLDCGEHTFIGRMPEQEAYDL